MSHNVEKMMYVRQVPWHGLGTRVEEAPNSADALRIAGLNWRVIQEEIQVIGGSRIPNYKANIRESDGSVLGVVTDRYQIVQNEEAFSFTDGLIGGDVRYETAGSLSGGRKIWLLAKMPSTEIVGDKTEPYLCFSNTHDGSGAIRVCMTPVRVVCNNTLNLAFQGTKRSWATKHVGNMSEKMEEAKYCLEMANSYMEGLAKYADKLANTTITTERINEILNELFPVKDSDSDRKKDNIQELKNSYMVCYFAPDIAKFEKTAWGAVNAMSDMITHSAPKRQTEHFYDNRWGRIMDGHDLLDKMVELIGVKA